MMRPPRFWGNPPARPGWQARLLTPLAGLVTWAAAARQRRALAERVGVPVICVGNINIGGTGKTPSVIALVEMFQARGIAVHVVSRGYGGSLQGPVEVQERHHSADEVGDEPLLIAAFTRIWVAKDRAAGARAATRAGAEVILLDDGFQNPGLAKDLSFVVVDAGIGFGNGRVFPAGGLREPPQTGLARADAIILIGSPEARAVCRTHWPILGLKPVLEAELRPLETGMDWAGRKFLAFAGIGRPEKFYATLRALGADLVQTESLGDHQKLSLTLLKRLEADAIMKGAQLATTEKDATRIPQDFRRNVVTLPVRLHFQDPDALRDLLASHMPEMR